jgi:ferredoxin
LSRRQKSAETFVPDPEQMALWPEISGNTINGLGEVQPRRPSPIMWHDARMLAHGKVQEWFWQQGHKVPELLQLRSQRQQIIDAEPAPVAEEKAERIPEENDRLVRQLAAKSGADLVGIIRLQPEWVFEQIEFDYPWIVVLGTAMDYEQLATAPELTSALEVVDKYTKGWIVSRPIEDWIRSQGWRAEAHGGPMAGPVNMIPAALACGFGELGKHGSIINREYGSCFRLAAVFTDLPLLEDEPDTFGADDFCLRCQVCIDSCPVDAIGDEKQMVRGAEKWYVDFDKCLPYFAETHGCGICIAVCPWSATGRAPVLAERWTRIRKRRRSESKP